MKKGHPQPSGFKCVEGGAVLTLVLFLLMFLIAFWWGHWVLLFCSKSKVLPRAFRVLPELFSCCELASATNSKYPGMIFSHKKLFILHGDKPAELSPRALNFYVATAWEGKSPIRRKWISFLMVWRMVVLGTYWMSFTLSQKIFRNRKVAYGAWMCMVWLLLPVLWLINILLDRSLVAGVKESLGDSDYQVWSLLHDRQNPRSSFVRKIELIISGDFCSGDLVSL